MLVGGSKRNFIALNTILPEALHNFAFAAIYIFFSHFFTTKVFRFFVVAASVFLIGFKAVQHFMLLLDDSFLTYIRHDIVSKLFLILPNFNRFAQHSIVIRIDKRGFF